MCSKLLDKRTHDIEFWFRFNPYTILRNAHICYKFPNLSVKNKQLNLFFTLISRSMLLKNCISIGFHIETINNFSHQKPTSYFTWMETTIRCIQKVYFDQCTKAISFESNMLKSGNIKYSFFSNWKCNLKKYQICIEICFKKYPLFWVIGILTHNFYLVWIIFYAKTMPAFKC